MSASRTSTAGTKADRRAGAELRRMRRPPTHPGEVFLEEFLEPLGYGAQSEAARRMNMSTNRLNEIVKGKRPVTAESAVLMAAVSGTSPQMWLHMQADYDLWHELQRIDTSTIKPITIADASPARAKTA